jgi:Cu(I)/Ag(I) efflux system membrane fusion protein
MTNNTSKIAAALSLLAVGIAIGWGLNRGSHQQGDQAAAPAAVAAKAERKVLYWYDPMVPTQRFDKPGKSPFMDMQLVAKYADEEAGAASGGVSVSPQALQSLGVRIATVERLKVAGSIDAVGSLQLNERDISIVQARSSGFVEKVYAHAPGEVIAAGAAIADLLLPDWVAAQREFLAVKALNDDALTAAVRQRLALLGMPESLIAQVERSGAPQGRYTVTAPAGGLLVELMVRPGMTVAPGMSLARINGLATVWLEVAVPEAQAAALRHGQAAHLRFAAFPGEVFDAKVAAILPEANRETRTLRLRLEIPNRGQRLKAGMFAQVALSGPQQEALVVSSEAVIRTGKRALVYLVDAPGRFRPVEVELGAEVGDKLIVLRGLEAGAQVVASAQFLIDSEASLMGVTAAVAKPAASAAEPATTSPSTYSAVGTLVELNGAEAMLSHEAIPALKWPPMTMGFKLANAQLGARLKPKQGVQFSFVKQGDDYVITAIKALPAQGVKP